MATIIQNTIGTGGDYTSVQTWDDAAPADLVAADQLWEGLVLPQNLASASSVIGGSTTSASCYKHLTAQAGGSFIDNPAHPLVYDDTNGATIFCNDNYSDAISLSEQNTKLSRLQIGGKRQAIVMTGSDSATVEDCILYSTRYFVIQTNNSSNNKFVNCLVLCNQVSTNQACITGGGYFYGCIVSNISATTPASGVNPDYASSHFYNSVFSNVTDVPRNKPAQVICTDCFTTGNPHTGCTVVALDETTGTGWVDASLGLAGDYKLNPTSALVDAGSLWPPYTDFDIYGTPRGASPDVGCYEIGGPPVGVDHATDGDVEGNTADITGTATLTEPAPHHQATGAVAGLTSTVTGTAKRFLLHTTSGDVVDSTDATVTGQAELINAVYLHETEGVLTGQLGTVVGTARRFRTHTTNGILLGDLAAVVGLAEIVSPPGEHETYGALSGQHGTVVGTAKHLRKHVTSGNVVDSTDATVTGEAVKFAEHDTSGIIVGYDAKVVGSATNVGSLTLTPADIAAIVAAIKAEIIPVDIVRVNHIDVDGTGADSDPWGPV